MNPAIGNGLELHYYFRNPDQHSMDAYIRNKCEGEVLKIIAQLSTIMDLSINVETFAHEEGGLKDIIKITASNPMVQGVIVGVLGTVLSQPLIIDRELRQLQKEEIRLEIEERELNIKKLKMEVLDENQAASDPLAQNLLIILINEYRVIRARSDFYKQLKGYRPIVKFSICQVDDFQEEIDKPKIVERDDFDDFILSSDDIPSVYDDNANIEVVAPVLRKGNFKWKGIYLETTMDFYMKDKDFKNQIYNKEIAFKNGVKLTCVLEIQQKLNEVGEIYISSYSVVTVLGYSEKGEVSETKQGQQYFRNKKARQNQKSLFEDLP